MPTYTPYRIRFSPYMPEGLLADCIFCKDSDCYFDKLLQDDAVRYMAIPANRFLNSISLACPFFDVIERGRVWHHESKADSVHNNDLDGLSYDIKLLSSEINSKFFNSRSAVVLPNSEVASVKEIDICSFKSFLLDYQRCMNCIYQADQFNVDLAIKSINYNIAVFIDEMLLGWVGIYKYCKRNLTQSCQVEYFHLSGRRSFRLVATYAIAKFLAYKFSGHYVMEHANNSLHKAMAMLDYQLYSEYVIISKWEKGPLESSLINLSRPCFSSDSCCGQGS